MPNQAGTIEQLILVIGRALAPLQNKLAPANVLTFLAELGVQCPPALLAQPAFSAALASAAAAAGALEKITTDLAAAITADNTAAIAAKGVELVAKVITLVNSLKEIATRLNAAAGAVPGIPAADVTAFASHLDRKLLDYMLVSELEKRQPELAQILPWTGLIERLPQPPGNDDTKPPFIQRSVHLDRLGDLLTKPEQLFSNLFKWGTNDQTGLLTNVDALLRQTGINTTLTPAPPAAPTSITSSIFTVTPTATNPTGLAVTVNLPAPGPLDLPIKVSNDWTLHFKLTAGMPSGITVTVSPPASVSFTGGAISGAASVEVVGQRADSSAFILIGQTAGSRLQVQKMRLAVGLKLSSAPAAAEPTIEAEIIGGKMVIDLSSGDGFIQKVAGGGKLEADLDLKALWSAKGGLSIVGSSAIEFAIPVHVSIGPLEILTIYIRISLAPDGSLPAELSGAFAINLGPLKASVDRIGLLATTSFPAGGGNLGPANMAFAFKPPNGIGLAVDAGIIVGGGFLSIDTERGEYAGALELTFSGFLSLKAIGLITTKMPDGSKGFSLLIIITAEFGTGIQLGFGFTLLAVGGLLGLNRTMKLQELMDGIRTGAIESIMFPQNVVANAPKIISDLRTIFPPQEGKFLIGPMAKLGWGTPTLASVSLGVIIEIPGNIAILGVLKIAIPADEVALIILQVNFAGAIEFDRKRLYFFAALFESRIVFLTIEGEMGLLVAFGDDANFVVSVGGFHPRFNPPPLPFPSPKRISVSLLSSPVSRVTIQGYFAVTSNTMQFGARVDVFYGLDILNVQGYLAFDALFQFSPFHFIIEISASFSVNVFGAGLFSVSIGGSLSGPGPWHLDGHGSISLLFWDVDVDFETTWGESPNTNLPPVTVMPILVGEINKKENWRASLPASNNLLVSLRKMPAEESGMILHPLGSLHISQRALPLELKLAKVGTQKPSDVNRLSVALTGGGLAKIGDTFEQFAPAQFQDFSDADKLSRPAFAPEKSGLDLTASGDDMRSSVMVKRIVRYEEIIMDSNFKRFQTRFKLYFGSLFNFFLNGNAAAQSNLSKATKAKLQPFEEKISVKTETYAVAFQSNNKTFRAESASFHSEASARDYLNTMIGEDASLADQIHVIPGFEKAA